MAARSAGGVGGGIHAGGDGGGAEGADLGAQGAGPRHPSGRAAAAGNSSGQISACPHRRTHGIATRGAAFRLGRGTSRSGSAGLVRKTVQGRHQKSHPPVEARLLESVARVGRTLLSDAFDLRVLCQCSVGQASTHPTVC